MAEESNPRGLSIEDGVLALRQSREAKEQPQGEEVSEQIEDQAEQDAQDDTEAETEEVTDQSEAEEQEESEAEADEEPEIEEESSEDDLYEIEGETFTLKQLQEWKKGGLREADYTQKTQKLSEERKAFIEERGQWESEREQVQEALKQQKAQLQDALATFAIEQDAEPNPDGKTWEQYQKEKSAWDKRQKKRSEAREAYQALAAEQHQEVVQRETARLMQYLPAWRDPETFRNEAEAIVKTAGEYGFSAQEMTGITDHRVFLLLNDLKRLRAEADTRKTSESVAAKKVTKAAKKLAPGSKPAKNQPTKELRQKRDQLRKSGSMQDAVQLLRAKRAQG